MQTAVDAKVIGGVAALDSMVTELFVAKFAFSSGAHGVISGDFNVSSQYLAARPDWLKYGPNLDYRSLQVAVYNEDAWAKYQNAIVEGSLCTTRLGMAIFRTSVPMADQQEGETEDVRFNMDNTIKPEQNSHYWYCIVADCSLEEYDAHPPQLVYELVFKNDGSHLPADEDGMFISHVFVFLMLVGFLVGLGMGVRKSLAETKQVHLAVLIVGVATLFQLVSIICELHHLKVYIQNGLGMRWRHTWMPMDFFSEVWQGLSELLIQFMLISLAFGWTIIPNTGADGGFFKALARPYELFKQTSKASIFVGALAFVQFTLELAGRAYEDDFNQFHDHEHWPGYILMVMRICLAGLFTYGIYLTKASTVKNQEEEMTRFFRKLQFTGSLWFLAFPMTVFLSSIAAPYRRHGIVTIGAITTQVGALGYLMFMFLTRSDYYKISSLRNMGSIMGSGQVRAGKVCVD
jgi:hypothetical protein